MLRDEERRARLDAYRRTVADAILGEAASAVIEASGEPGASCSEDGVAMDEDELQRILDRAGIDRAPADLHLLAFKDGHGRIHLPLDTMVEIARAFAAAEPRAVTEYLDDRPDGSPHDLRREACDTSRMCDDFAPVRA